MNTAASQESPTTSTPPPTVWQWVALSVLLLGGLAFAVAHAPPGWQRPGPTAFWLAVLGGIFVGGIAVVNRVQNRRLVFSVAFAVIALAITGMTAERYRLYVNALEKEYLGPLQPNKAAEMEKVLQHGSAVETLMEQARADRREVFESKRPFRVFLAFRLQALGISREPWPLIFFLGESLLGGLIGAFVATRWHAWQSESPKPTSE